MTNQDDERVDVGLELSSLMLRMMLEDEHLSWTEAVDRIQASLDEQRFHHADGQPLTARDEARARAVAEGNPEGFSPDPEPIPDVFRERDER